MNKSAFYPVFFGLLFLLLLPCLGFCQEYELVEEVQFRELPDLGQRDGVTDFRIDKDGFLWLVGQLGLQRYDGTRNKVFEYTPDKENSLAGNWVINMEQDSKGFFWIGVFGVGIQKFDPVTEKFYSISPKVIDSTKTFSPYFYEMTIGADDNIWIETQSDTWLYKPEENSLRNYSYMNVALSQNGDIWGMNHKGVHVFNTVTSEFLLFYKFEEDLYVNNIAVFKSSSTGDLFFSFEEATNKLYQFTPSTNQWEEYEIPANGRVNNISEVSHKKILITIEGRDGKYNLAQFDLETNQLNSFSFDKGAQEKLRESNALIEVGDNVFISGNNSIGVFNIIKDKSRFLQIEDPDGNNFSLQFISFYETPHFSLGLSRHLTVDLEKNRLKKNESMHADFKKMKSNNNIRSNDMWVQDTLGNYWICETNDVDLKTVIYYFEPEKNRLTTRGDINHGGQVLIADIVQGDEGDLWIGYWGGLARFHPLTNTYDIVPLKTKKGSTVGIRTLYKDSSGDIWIATQDGLYHYISKTEDIHHYLNIANDTTSLSYNMVSSIREDESGIIWIGTSYGLNAFNKKSKEFTTHYFQGSLYGNTIVSLEVVDSIVWFINGFGLNQFNPKTKELNTFDNANGLLNDIFHEKKSFKLSSGKLVFAGEKGIDIIDPKTLKKNQHIPPIKLTGFSLSNQEVKIMGPDSILKKSITYTESITLNHDQNDFSFRFAALDYTAPEKNEYAYQMVGFDDDWQYIGNNSAATFTNFDPGVYNLKVKGSNNDGIWNEEGTSLEIIINPPWYWSWWTKTLYGLLFIGSLYAFYRFQLRRRLAERESLRLRELDEAKNQLYTNITHDFRTPLTIIQGMTEQIKSKQYAQEKRLIQRNSQKLLQMVNQILDLAKLEAGKLSLSLQQSDIIAFLKNEMTAYIALATSQNIDLQFQCEQESLEMDFDPFLLRQVIANLLSNALKFIDDDGKIVVRIQQTETGGIPQLLLAVEDTGKGIPADQLEKIFDRYYQVQDSAVYSTLGTGIGLAHTKELVHLMGGEIAVKSEIGVGATFSFVLPITRKAVKTEIEEILPAYLGSAAVGQLESVDKQTTVVENFDLPLVLVVEDNEDVIQYLIRCLQEDYRILTALNGAEGVKTALKYVPDLIISDVMMPEVDGFNLTAQLKNDERSSHIPIVLLTAKADQEAKIEGLQSGADAYLHKPFDRKEMLVRLEKLLELRKNLQLHYASPEQLAFNATDELSLDERFLKNVQAKIRENLDDADYSVEQLAKDVHLSRAQLYRKVKALTGESVSAYMRLIRLTQAKKLLESAKFSVAEVAYKVGFGDPAYFSRRFSELFGFPPSESLP